eukprot:scaffold44662_cov28-Tisochrysis_lutea.AAC.3
MRKIEAIDPSALSEEERMNGVTKLRYMRFRESFLARGCPDEVLFAGTPHLLRNGLAPTSCVQYPQCRTPIQAGRLASPRPR